MRNATQEIYYFFSNGIIKSVLGKYSSYIFLIFSVPGKLGKYETVQIACKIYKGFLILI